MSKKKNYWTEPKIKKYPLINPDGTNGKNWYVWFRFNGGNPHRFSLDINKQKDYDSRLEEAIVLREALKRKLESGWIPEKKKVEKKKVEIPTYNFNQALDFSINKLEYRLKKKSISCYKGTVRFAKDAAKKLDYHNINIVDINRFHIKNILEKIKKERNWSNHSYNKHTGYLKSVLTELVEYQIIEKNPSHGIRTLKYHSPPTEILTSEEQTAVINHLKIHHPTFLVFIKFLYQTGIRPKELLGLKIKCIDIEREMILVSSDDSKNSKYRLVPIKKNILEDLKKMIRNVDEEWYLFGSPRHFGGNYILEKSYSPSPYRTKRDTATRHWKKWVKEGLGIEKNMYSMKHKGANDMLKDGVDLDTIKVIFGHSDSKITEIYANNINQIRFQKAKDSEREFI
ncbi:Tyrosine recombinase XerD [Candidatus Ornithobacterium hominis]|uniref:Tyrosine recombinase XerD n=1 Tax=Candidatus Ornithobacterium hominis TaxID=2497989 RepID=A0A383U3P0_9FLAO|nr:tyrosine-type recombinase/integrase [Candidatus Ornithobacterium hominis]MCT7905139.1 tyrosine-type recombinase/integrase [Candidatus Ornithobacterium hominis]SZD74197.1 Tyrosine recombinase XerD [Candidatus Ornithobacterium hominis]